MYNRSTIMKAAWAAYRNRPRNLRGIPQGTFADCLKIAWANAKRRATHDTEFLYQMQDHHSNAEVAAHYCGGAA